MGKWWKLKKMHASSFAFTVVECIVTSKSCTKLYKKEAAYPFHFQYVFSWFNTLERHLPWNISLAQLKITVIYVAIQINPRFPEMLVLGNRISKQAYIPGFWICFWFWICQGFGYTMTLNIPGLHSILNMHE